MTITKERHVLAHARPAIHAAQPPMRQVTSMNSQIEGSSYKMPCMAIFPLRPFKKAFLSLVATAFKIRGAHFRICKKFRARSAHSHNPVYHHVAAIGELQSTERVLLY